MTPRHYIVTITSTGEGKLGGVERSMSYVHVTGSGESIECSARSLAGQGARGACAVETLE